MRPRFSFRTAPWTPRRTHEAQITWAIRFSSFAQRLRGQGHGEPITGSSFTGVLFAVAGIVGSATPSLLPRPWYMQGIVAAVVGVLAYAVGTVVGAALRALGRTMALQISVSTGARQTLTAVWVILVTALVFGAPIAAFEQQQLTAQYVGVEVPGRWYIAASVGTGIALFVLLIGLWRIIAGVVDAATAAFEGRAWREWVARLAASVLTVALVGLTLDRVVFRGGLAIADYQSQQVNNTSPTGRSAPTSSLRSGGPGSHESWESLGQDGAIFVTSGPDRQAIASVTGRAAAEPIRVFVGVVNDYSIADSTARVLAEMERTGAFSRSAIYLANATSTGFINEWSAQAFEYLTGGDCATISMAYSTLPSAIALVSAPDLPPQASRSLLSAVRARLNSIPAHMRPKLYVGGESLGSYAGNGAFDSPEEMLAQVDGAVWTGTPSFTPLHGALTQRRRPGSTEVNPVVDGGLHVRFAGNAAQLGTDGYGVPLGSWRHPRVVYLQHSTDPVVWWSPSLIASTPAWLQETRPAGPMAAMSWMPLVTFWQVTADMSMSNSVPGGHGHRYFESETVPAWAAVLGLTTAPGVASAPAAGEAPVDLSRVQTAIHAATS